ncbi:oxidoreductase [Rhizocola hellebori]|uniref:Oxidoreductase n=1 Tax=Rhizocola hellebori TaxID=1392758 RepID=A0A8J3VLB3_9ACTN|nr:aldo/keto reductase [Rhizocola hellebori]GIH09821.1 oxidoreductase [Rhizocola hellebori]
MHPAERVRLGRSDLPVTRLGLGLAPIGGLYTAVPPQQAIATIDMAFQKGIRLFDTAPLYGYGRSETLAGKALAPHPRDWYTLSTKVGRVLEPGGDNTQDIWADPPPGVAPRLDFSPAAIRQSFQDSLDRLGLERIDIVHLHDPDDHYEEAAGGAFDVLAQLRAAGTIGAISVGMNQGAMLARFARELPLDCVMLAGRYTLLDHSGLDELLPVCAQRGIGVLAAGVYNSGLLADPQPGARYNYGPASAALLAKALAIKDICDRYEIPLRAAAIQFPFGHRAVTSVVIGARTPAEVEDAVAMCAVDIPPQLWQDLRAEGLLPLDVAVPGHS